jgi:hypothetical protein
MSSNPISTPQDLTAAHKTLFEEGIIIRYKVAGAKYIDAALS